MRNDYQTLYLVMNSGSHFQSHSCTDLPSRANSITLHHDIATLFETVSAVHPKDRVGPDEIRDVRRDLLLPRLIPVGPEEIEDRSIAGRGRIVRRLAKALRGERARGRSGHWTYSLNRHIGLLQAFKAERAALKSLYVLEHGAALMKRTPV
jgi:hypothetical protein